MNTSKHSADAEPGGKLVSHNHLITPELIGGALSAKDTFGKLTDIDGHRLLLHRVFDGQYEIVVKRLKQDRLTTDMTAIYNGKAEFRFPGNRRVYVSLDEQGQVHIDSGELFPLERTLIVEIRDELAFVMQYAEQERQLAEAKLAAKSADSVSETVDPS